MPSSKYTKSQITFIISNRIKGKNYDTIKNEFNKKFKQNVTAVAMEKVFSRNKRDYDLGDYEKSAKIKREQTKEEVIKIFCDFVKKHKYIPSRNNILNLGVTRHTIEYHFENYTLMESFIRKSHSEIFDSIIDESSFTTENYEVLANKIKRYKKFFITTAVTGCEVNEAALKSVESFCDKNKALLLVLPCSDPAHNYTGRYQWSLSTDLPKGNIVFRDINLNSNVFLSTIKLSAKQINPLTGLSRIGQRHGSFIYASPKQSLEYVANSAEKTIPRALMTTGAITKPDYNSSYYMSDRTAYIANHDHLIGGIIVELEDDKFFHFRQVQIEPDTGTFYDLDKKYLSNGKVENSTADLVQLGDYHVGETDPLAKKVAKELCDLVKPKFLTVEDFLNGHSHSHHDLGKCLTNAKKADTNSHSLEKELKDCQAEINDILKWNFKTLVFKYGNHEDFLYRWLNRGGYIDEPHNMKLGVRLSNAVLNEAFDNPFEYALTKLFPVNDLKRVKFLKVNDSFKVKGIENGAHGHLGPNGSRNPGLQGIEKSYGAANVGHSHTAGIWRNVFRVGTTSYLKVSYNDGPSSWTQTHLIQHENGSRQLINCINGRFKT